MCSALFFTVEIRIHLAIACHASSRKGEQCRCCKDVEVHFGEKVDWTSDLAAIVRCGREW